MPPIHTPRLALALCLLLSASPVACRSPHGTARPPASETVTPVADVIARRAPDLMKIPGVVGVHEGETRHHRPCIRIMVDRRSPERDARLPRVLDGYPVEIEATGAIRPMKGGNERGGG